mmetsp:Transcript_23453/g.39778  ORF Transcript_23453/g.39778 Transcript_23453/m.39778 type:complete len:255 (+) Transcript_23453:1507-2271(+)
MRVGPHAEVLHIRLWRRPFLTGRVILDRQAYLAPHGQLLEGRQHIQQDAHQQHLLAGRDGATLELVVLQQIVKGAHGHVRVAGNVVVDLRQRVHVKWWWLSTPGGELSLQQLQVQLQGLQGGPQLVRDDANEHRFRLQQLVADIALELHRQEQRVQHDERQQQHDGDARHYGRDQRQQGVALVIIRGGGVKAQRVLHCVALRGQRHLPLEVLVLDVQYFHRLAVNHVGCEGGEGCGDGEYDVRDLLLRHPRNNQ